MYEFTVIISHSVVHIVIRASNRPVIYNHTREHTLVINHSAVPIVTRDLDSTPT